MQDMQAESPEEAARLLGKLKDVVARIEDDFKEQADARQVIEDRWLEDLRQFHGLYEPNVAAALRASGRSEAFVNMTRPKSMAWAARLGDMLHPTDQLNWKLRTNPLPDLAQLPPEEQNAAKADMNRRSEEMEALMSEQASEARYTEKSRAAIYDMCRLGTGIIKGPMRAMTPQRRWIQEQSPDGSVVATLESKGDGRPDFLRVDPWLFYPDMNALEPHEMRFTFELHLKTDSDMRRLAKLPGVSAATVRRLMMNGKAREPMPDFLTDLRALHGDGTKAVADQRWQIKEYHGPLDYEDLKLLCQCYGSSMIEDMGELDPLAEIPVIIHYCQGEVIRFGLHPLESGAPLYSICPFEPADDSVFGLGVPRLVSDSQRAINAAWRLTMDNAALASGPQILIRKQAVQPADGQYGLAPWKVWLVDEQYQGTGPALETAVIPINQVELSSIIEMGRRFLDEEVSMPLIAQGEQAAHITQTAHGMAILQNAATVVLRRVTKWWDDRITTPTMTRLYEWNMQFHDDPKVKADMAIEAIGSSVLLQRELQGQALMSILAQFGAHPVFGPMLKHAEGLRELMRTMMITPDAMVLSDDEIAEAAKMAAESQEQPQDPAVIAAEARLKAAELESETKVAVATMQRDLEMFKLAETANVSYADIEARMTQSREKARSDERKLAVEVADKQRRPDAPSAGGLV